MHIWLIIIILGLYNVFHYNNRSLIQILFIHTRLIIIILGVYNVFHYNTCIILTRLILCSIIAISSNSLIDLKSAKVSPSEVYQDSVGSVSIDPDIVSNKTFIIM